MLPERAIARTAPLVRYLADLDERLADRQLVRTILLALALGVGAFLRLWQVNHLGYNTDEAVYAGQGASIAEDPALKQFFPIFRAHPILFQSILSLAFRFGVVDGTGRLIAVGIGILTVYVAYLLGKSLYGPSTGLFAALFLAVMPYHVVVTRQVLLDGPMTLFATLTLYMLARYAETKNPVAFYAAGACTGLTMLSKTNGVVILGGLYVFLALAPDIKVRFRDLVISALCLGAVFSPYPLTLALAGRAQTGGNYAAWQLFRRPNHEMDFYLTNVVPAIGLAVIVAAVLGLVLLYQRRTWRETLLIAWVVVPVVFFQIWMTKGFQYLLPVAPVFAVLAGRMAAGLFDGTISLGKLGPARSWMGLLFAAVISISLAVPSWQIVQPSTSATFLAGSGGVPGGREMGRWVQDNTPEGAKFLAIGPSMANLVSFYGHRKAYGLSVSPNPLRRNPSYEPVYNPDAQIRNSELHYIIWDSYSAARSSFFSDTLMGYVHRYHGRAVHTETVTVTSPDGNTVEKPVIVIYEVRP